MTTTESASPAPHEHAAHADDRHHYAHIVPGWLLIAVFLTLIALTGVTVAASWVQFGPWNLLVAMIIATVKALLVALFFMHLLYDRGMSGVIFMAALVFVTLFITATLLDTYEYQDDIRQFDQLNPPVPVAR